MILFITTAVKTTNPTFNVLDLKVAVISVDQILFEEIHSSLEQLILYSFSVWNI
jgi:hypothetical protein